ncbi:hypothetical protein LWC34_38855 [Kibdelosporangium philippinense]|uniref:Uncharacterized protein n=1 Tax=Kibdelosporangium philippinense TaxID=211113 RepID=A0ABS8ZLQ5_9PSEU|nr:hypothetical protein [Kibdelosporangium philippinense]MCE7008730.1 hypothetical protein [Kibdelosporangium philippinense]
MARTAIAAEAINSQTTRTPTFTAAIADGHMTINDGSTFLRVRNTDASPKTVTVLIPSTLAGVVAANGGRQHTIPANTGDVTIGPFPPDYTQPSDGRIWWDYSAITGVTVAVLKVERNK